MQAGAADVSDAVITRASDDSTGADAASFYGVGAAVLATGGTVTVSNSTIETDAAGGAGVFAYADGVAYVSDTTITTRQNASGGTLQSGNGGLFYTTHTESEFVLSGVEIAGRRTASTSCAQPAMPMSAAGERAGATAPCARSPALASR